VVDRGTVAVRSQVPVFVVSRAFAMASTFAMTAVIARSVGATQAGQFFLIYAVTAILATCGRFGTDNMILKVAVRRGHQANNEIRNLLLLCSITGGTLATASALAVLLTRGATSSTLPPAALYVASASILPLAWIVTAGALLRGSQRVVSGIICELGAVPVLTSLYLLSPLVPPSPQLFDVLLAYTVASFITCIGSLVLISRLGAVQRLSEDKQAHPRHYARRIASKLAAMSGTSILFLVLTWAPILTLGLVSQATEVAYYTVAARLAAFVSLVPGLQTAYLAPRFAALFHEGHIQALNTLCHRTTLRACIVATPIACVLLAFPGWFLALFGPGFDGAHSPTRVLVAGALVVVAAGQINSLMLTCDLEATALGLNLLLLGVWVTIGGVVARSWGSAGLAVFAALALASYSISAAVILRIRRGITPSAYPKWEAKQPAESNQ
jgi:O-antigen/teichoic acid export membrane protein